MDLGKLEGERERRMDVVVWVLFWGFVEWILDFIRAIVYSGPSVKMRSGFISNIPPSICTKILHTAVAFLCNM